MGRRKPNRKLDLHHIVGVLPTGLDLIGNRKQAENEEPLVFCFIPPVRDALIRQCVVFPLILEHIISEARRVTLDQAGCEGGMVQCLDLFVSVVDCNQHIIQPPYTFLIRKQYALSNKINKKVPDALWHPGLLWLVAGQGLSMQGMAFRQAGALHPLCPCWDETVFLTPTQRDFMVCLCPVRIPALFQEVITDSAFEPAESPLATNGRLKLCLGLSGRKTADEVRHDMVVVDLIPGREWEKPTGAVFQELHKRFILQPCDERVWEAYRLASLPVVK